MAQIEIDDNNCCEYLQAGKVEAYHYLIRIYFPVLCNYAQTIIDADIQTAEDIITDAFLKSWEKRNDFKDFAHIKNFLYITVKNASFNFIRNKQREKAKHEIFSESYLNEEDFAFKEIVHAELMAEVRKAIDMLPAKMRKVFILSYVEQLSNAEIAARLNISDQTVRNQKSKSLSILRSVTKHISSTHLVVVLLLLEIKA
ncbi:MAG TPA: RNA polymerase sigma-70 factor [Arachidicoccus sp.]